MASDDQAGMEGQCPACGDVMRIPEPETTGTEGPKGIAPVGGIREKEVREEGPVEEPADEEPLDEEPEAELPLAAGIEEEPPIEDEEPEDLEEGILAETGPTPEKKSWIRSSWLPVLASIVAVLLVAIIVFVLVRREKEPPEQVMIMGDREPVVEEVEEETTALPSVTKMDEEPGTTQPSDEAEPVFTPVTESEETESALVEQPIGEETEGVSDTEEPVVASTGQEPLPVEETPPAEEVPPIEEAPAPEETLAAEETPPAEEQPEITERPPEGSFTVNLSSFKVKASAEQFAEQLREKGIGAYYWEADLGEKGLWYRVSVGGFPTRQEAEELKSELQEQGLSDIFITQVEGS
jgi:cell division septation protein DedD